MARYFAPLFVLCILFFSCDTENTVQFPVYGTSAPLISGSKAAREGLLDFSKRNKFEYHFDESFSVPKNSSFEVEYEFITKPAEGGSYSIILNMGTASWLLPVENNIIRYAVPVHDSFDGNFIIAPEKDDEPLLKILSVRFTGRWFGFNKNTGEYDLYTPFVNADKDGSFKVDIPIVFIPKGQYPEIEVNFSGESRGVMEITDKKLETYPGNNLIFIPAALFAYGGFSMQPSNKTLSAEAALYAQEVFSFVIKPCAPSVFPEPVKADPAFIINMSKKNWRNKNYEIFRWDRFPSLLIFDFESYAVQDKMFKRLAFFAEKSGFRGRLAHDSEIKELHAWNAHDYRAQDLAAFFDAAKKANFPLSSEEKQLEKILLSEKIIRESSGEITSGYGGIISVSRESAEYLRYRFITHECFHGIFFLDADFRDFSRRRWEQLPAPAKRFIISYFDFQQYDTKDEYLLINEFMAHVLQQSVSQAAEYFGHYLPLRLLETSWRASTLPKKDEASGTWPTLAAEFTTEAEAFSEYVNRRWGLAAGRVWGVQIKDK